MAMYTCNPHQGRETFYCSLSQRERRKRGGRGGGGGGRGGRGGGGGGGGGATAAAAAAIYLLQGSFIWGQEHKVFFKSTE